MKVVLRPERVEGTANNQEEIIMANSVDFTTLAIGALIGVGCRDQLKSAAKVAATTAASLASSVAVAVNSAAQMYDQSEKSQAPQGQNGNGGTV